jgi:hypothetical protein
LAALRKQSIDLVKSIIPMLDASVRPGEVTQAQVNETKSKLAQMEKNWPEASDLIEFDKIFDKGTPADIEAMCEDMPKAIEQRRELNALLMQTNLDMAEMMKKMPPPKQSAR